MQNINSESDLKDAILVLENRQAVEGRNIKEQFHLTSEAIKPINLIKNSLKGVFAAPEVKGNIVNSSIGLTAGLFSKLLYERGTHNPIKKIIGNALLVGVTNVIGKHAEPIKSVGALIFGLIRRKRPVQVIEIATTENPVLKG